MPRIKKKLVKVPTESEAKEALYMIAFNTTALTNIKAQMEAEIQAIREKYAEDLLLHNGHVKDNVALLEAFARENKDTFSVNGAALTGRMVGLGFVKVSSKVDFARGFKTKALEIVKGLGLTKYIRQKDELDKEQIIASREDADQMKKLATAGISVVQQESFFVDTKEEKVNV